MLQRVLQHLRRPPAARLNYRLMAIHQRARMANENATIQLSDVESRLCVLLDKFTKYLRETRNHDVECLIAGGWVRDKLLGLDSNDIDVALSSMMGFPFAVEFAEYLKSQGIEVTRVTKVESRAEQSKHLETAKVATLGLDLDFVNLRSEEYAEGSRIPTKVAFGTKLEDTLRRDTTINALLYNIHTRQVEDHTKKGLDDLRDGIIRTPLPPRQTFLDDPLRVLRCIRFASRYHYELVPELAESAKDPVIQTALDTKITRERVGEEIHKMMKGPDPVRAIKLIDSLSLHRSIFTPPVTTSPPVLIPTDLPRHSAVTASCLLSTFLSRPSEDSEFPQLDPVHPTLLSHVLNDPSTKRRLYLASALTPFKGLTYTEKKKQKSVVEASIREGLKLGVQEHYMDGIPLLFASADLLHHPLLENFTEPSQRVAIGLLLRDKQIHNSQTGSHWSSSLLFSLVQELVPSYHTGDGSFNVPEANNIIALYTTFVSTIEELDLPAHIEDPPILNGNEVTALLGTQRPGPWLGHVLNDVVRWQLDRPHGSKEECAEWVKDEVRARRIVIGGGKGGEEEDRKSKKRRQG